MGDLAPRQIAVTSKSPDGDISVVTLIRTDTTLDHSQKAEKVCNVWVRFFTSKLYLNKLRWVLFRPKFHHPFRSVTSASTSLKKYHQCCSAHEGALSGFSIGDITQKSSSRYWELSAASRESSGNHFRSDPVRVQSTLLIFP